MEAITCPACGRPSYSAAKLSDCRAPVCPTCGADLDGPEAYKSAINGLLYGSVGARKKEAAPDVHDRERPP